MNKFRESDGVRAKNSLGTFVATKSVGAIEGPLPQESISRTQSGPTGFLESLEA